MKTLLIALNSKYIHTSLSVWYLKAACREECGEVKVLEFTINDSIDSILAAIYREKSDVAAFSCYIWNIDQVLKLVGNLKRVTPKIKVILGGPEVSFDAEQVMAENPDVDYIIAGEGEIALKLILGHLSRSTIDITAVNGLTYRKEGSILKTGLPCLIDSLDSIPSPYSNEMLSSLNNRIVYYESSRGCPFSCSYCISSTFEGVRYFSMPRVLADLGILIKAGVRQVKFVDRTFNCNRARAKEIFRYIIENASNMNFHFEAAGDLFDDEMFEILSGAPEGLIQFEIGIQTTNPRTLEEIDRKTSVQRVFRNIDRLNSAGNIHLHLDLIAGLPYEPFESFITSFNEVYRLKPQQLQLGFLKMLKGSRIRREKEKHDYQFRSYPPYEILSNAYLSFDELMTLKEIEELVERYYNSGRFIKVLEYLTGNLFVSPFSFFQIFAEFCIRTGYSNRALSSRESYTVLLEFVREITVEADPINMEWVHELIKFDFLRTDHSGSLPAGLKREMDVSFKERCFDFLREDANIRTYLPSFTGMPPKQIYKQVHFELFFYDVANRENPLNDRGEVLYIFDYRTKNRVTGLYDFIRVR